MFKDTKAGDVVLREVYFRSSHLLGRKERRMLVKATVDKTTAKYIVINSLYYDREYGRCHNGGNPRFIKPYCKSKDETSEYERLDDVVYRIKQVEAKLDSLRIMAASPASYMKDTDDNYDYKNLSVKLPDIERAIDEVSAIFDWLNVHEASF